MKDEDSAGNHTGAAEWFRKSAEQGYAQAQLALGYMYAYGRGIAEDDEQAVKWFRKAAEQGDVGGQYHLGLAYLEGAGVTRDYDQAAQWFRKAAEQGISLDDLDLGP